MKWSTYVMGFSFVALLVLGKAVSYLYEQNQQLDTQLLAANISLQAKAQTITTMKTQLQKVHELDTELQQELTNANQTIENLELDLASGDKRLHINATCPAPMPNQPTTASVANATACELNQDARQDYLHLRRELERTQLQVSGLQRYIQTLPVECIQGNSHE